jgi:hypothetical protein
MKGTECSIFSPQTQNIYQHFVEVVTNGSVDEIFNNFLLDSTRGKYISWLSLIIQVKHTKLENGS